MGIDIDRLRSLSGDSATSLVTWFVKSDWRAFIKLVPKVNKEDGSARVSASLKSNCLFPAKLSERKTVRCGPYWVTMTPAGKDGQIRISVSLPVATSLPQSTLEELVSPVDQGGCGLTLEEEYDPSK